MEFAQEHSVFTKHELLEAMRPWHDIKEATLAWVLFHLVQTNQLARLKRGVYTLQRRQAFLPKPTQAMIGIAKTMRSELPYAEFSLYSGDYFAPWHHHLTINHLIYLAVPRFMVENAADMLESHQYTTYPNPDEEMLNRHIDMQKENIVVLPLISQAPLQNSLGVPTPHIETLLVDLFASPVFKYLQGAEYARMFINAYRQYAIQEDRLLRYASRRNAKPQLQLIFNEAKSHD